MISGKGMVRCQPNSGQEPPVVMLGWKPWSLTKDRGDSMHIWLINSGLLLLTSWSNLQTQSPARPLTFDDRVRAQEAIERVYYEHRIWPKENPGPKPPFEEMISRAQIDAKVEDYLKKSVALDKFWKRPIQPEQLQAEMDRMAKQTQDPETLHELFAALDNDAYLIAECLARPILADRLIRNWYAFDIRFHREVREKADSAMRLGRISASEYSSNETRTHIKYQLASQPISKVETPIGRIHDDPYSVSIAPEDFARIKLRFSDSTGQIGLRETAEAFILESAGFANENAIIVDACIFSKRDFETWWKPQAELFGNMVYPEGVKIPIYLLPSIAEEQDLPTTGTWLASSLNTIPDPRYGHVAVWTGTEMIIWGGYNGGYTNIGARYNPSTDTWALTSSGGSCPSARSYPTAVWTGREMIIWGGFAGEYFNTGGCYDPLTNSWSATSEGIGVPDGRYRHTAIWTGEEMIVWGGYAYSNVDQYYNSGGRYDPVSNSWTPTSIAANCPQGRARAAAVWTGEEMIVWGGSNYSCPGNEIYLNTGGRYSPISDRWATISTAGHCPSERRNHSAVWTGVEMIIWGGYAYKNGEKYFDTGSRYNPTDDSWKATSTVWDCPSGRIAHTAVWTGSTMIVWGGLTDYDDYLPTGGCFDPIADVWSATSESEGCPSGRAGHTVVWTGSEMIVWGGKTNLGPSSAGGRYDVGSNSWVPTSLQSNAPSGRHANTAVWTGLEMIVWGGADRVNYFSTGGLYSPGTDSWAPTSTGNNCPRGRRGHTAVWTGVEMIVWGGNYYEITWVDVNSGGRYNPALDSWQSTSTALPCPSARRWHIAFWTGTEMLLWGGTAANSGALFNGGRYDPGMDTWKSASTGPNCPSERQGFSSVWTGSSMIIWGGSDPDGYSLQSGGIYDPGTDSWKATAIDYFCPGGRKLASAVWTGDEMLVWGGFISGPEYPITTPNGARYRPSSNTWAPISSENHLWYSLAGHSVLWTGRQMLLWGGDVGIWNTLMLNTGVLFDPNTDSWTGTSTGNNCPSPRYEHSTVWTGKLMIVWGGEGSLQTGGIYRPYSPHDRPVTPP